MCWRGRRPQPGHHTSATTSRPTVTTSTTMGVLATEGSNAWEEESGEDDESGEDEVRSPEERVLVGRDFSFSCFVLYLFLVW